MTVYVLRHARAGRRSAWTDDDVLRPLTKVGRRQALGLLEVLADTEIEQIISSPYVRCRQSVEPLAQQRRLPVDLSDALGEGASLDDALRLFEKASHRHSVLCTHGDMVEALLSRFKANGVKIAKLRMEKGSAWALETKGGTVVKATYLPPPAPQA